ncbi:MAG TPA: hypothetical protein VMH05_16845 [Bryobacteraceae bacterium]|nr:hypothetical protein [Bryobacteraceae bacterium]
MKPKTIRTRVDLPADLHRRLCEAAARQHRTVQQFIAAAIEHTISAPQGPKSRLVLDRPLLAGKRKPIAITNEEIYKRGFP